MQQNESTCTTFRRHRAYDGLYRGVVSISGGTFFPGIALDTISNPSQLGFVYCHQNLSFESDESASWLNPDSRAVDNRTDSAASRLNLEEVQSDSAP